MSTMIFIQARTGSTRLPGKTLMKIGRYSVLEHCYRACVQVAPVCVLIPYGDEKLHAWCIAHNILYREGPEQDVLTRYMQAVRAFGADYGVRITSDCPFLSPAQLTHCVLIAENGRYDYVTNCLTSPVDGREIDVLSRAAWEWVDNRAKTNGYREHVTTYIKDHIDKFNQKLSMYEYRDPLESKFVNNLSIDTEEDLHRARFLWKEWS